MRWKTGDLPADYGPGNRNGAVDLMFLAAWRGARQRSFKSKTALDPWICRAAGIAEGRTRTVPSGDTDFGISASGALARPLAASMLANRALLGDDDPAAGTLADGLDPAEPRNQGTGRDLERPVLAAQHGPTFSRIVRRPRRPHRPA